MVPKVSLQDFLLILGAPQPKIIISSFWPPCDQMMLLTGVRQKPVFSPFMVRLWVKFSKFWPGETSVLYANGPECFSPGFFTYFGRPTAKNYNSVFLTVVRPKPGFSPFDRRATISLSWYFWPMVRLMGVNKLLFEHEARGLVEVWELLTSRYGCLSRVS